MGPTLSLGEQMVVARRANRGRLGGNYGTWSGNRNHNGSGIAQMRAPIRLTRVEAKTTAPPPPTVPKPAPPHRPVRPPPLFTQPTAARREVLRAIRRLAADFRPTLRLVSEIADSQIRDPAIARTGGGGGPPIPHTPSSYRRFVDVARGPPSPLRATTEGIRSEIAPDPKAFRGTPEESRPSSPPRLPMLNRTADVTIAGPASGSSPNPAKFSIF